MIWPPKWSDACSKGGDGVCDGTENGRGEECACPCHSDRTNDLPLTIPGVRDWHDEMHGYVREEA